MLDDAQSLTEIPTGLEPVRDFDALLEMLSEASRWGYPVKTGGPPGRARLGMAGRDVNKQSLGLRSRLRSRFSVGGGVSITFPARGGRGKPSAMVSRMYPTSTTIAAFGPVNDPCYVMGLAQSADGVYLAASLSTHAIKVWHRGDGTLGACVDLTGHGGPVTDVSFPLPHEPWAILSSSEDGTTRLWDCRASGKAQEAQRYHAHFAKSHATAALGGGNDHLVAAGCQEKIIFWDRRAANGLEVFEDSHSEDVTRVRFQPSRRNRLFTASVDGLACAFDCGGNPADINDEAGLMAVMATETAIVEVGFCGAGAGAGEDDAFWVLTGNEECFVFDAGASAETLGDLTAHIPDTRAAACAAAAAAGCGALAEKVDYLVSCFSSPSAAGGAPLVVAGTQAGALGVFPVVRDRLELPGRTTLGAPLATFEGGHKDIVRAFVPGAAPVTGAEDSRVCVWGHSAPADGGESSGGKAARDAGDSVGSRRHSPY